MPTEEISSLYSVPSQLAGDQLELGINIVSDCSSVDHSESKQAPVINCDLNAKTLNREKRNVLSSLESCVSSSATVNEDPESNNTSSVLVTALDATDAVKPRGYLGHSDTLVSEPFRDRMQITASVECASTSSPENTDRIPSSVHESSFDTGEGTCTTRDLELHLDNTILSTIEMLDEVLKKIDSDDHFRYDEMSTEGKSKLLVILDCLRMLIQGANGNIPPTTDPIGTVTRSDGMIEGPAICEDDVTVSGESDPSFSETEETTDFMPNVPIIIVTRPDETIDFPKMCDDDMVPQENLKQTSGTNSLETETKADCIITSGREVQNVTRNVTQYPDCIGTSTNPGNCAADAVKGGSSFPSPVIRQDNLREVDMKKRGELQNSLECASTVGTAGLKLATEKKKEAPLIPLLVVSREPDHSMQSYDVSCSELRHRAPVKMDTTLSYYDQGPECVAVDNIDMQTITEPRQPKSEASLPVLVPAHCENKSSVLELFPLKMGTHDTFDVNLSEKLNCISVPESPTDETIDSIPQTISKTQSGNALGICVSEDNSGVFPSTSENMVQIWHSNQDIECSGIPAQRNVKEFAVVTPEATRRATEIPLGMMKTSNGSIDFNESQECQGISEPHLRIPKSVQRDPSGKSDGCTNSSINLSPMMLDPLCEVKSDTLEMSSAEIAVEERSSDRIKHEDRVAVSVSEIPSADTVEEGPLSPSVSMFPSLTTDDRQQSHSALETQKVSDVCQCPRNSEVSDLGISNAASYRKNVISETSCMETNTELLTDATHMEGANGSSSSQLFSLDNNGKVHQASIVVDNQAIMVSKKLMQSCGDSTVKILASFRENTSDTLLPSSEMTIHNMEHSMDPDTSHESKDNFLPDVGFQNVTELAPRPFYPESQISLYACQSMESTCLLHKIPNGGTNAQETLYLEMVKQGIANPDQTLTCKGIFQPSIPLEDITEIAPETPSALSAKYHLDPVRSVANSKESSTDVLYAVEANISTASDKPSLDIPNTGRTHSQPKCMDIPSSELFASDVTKDSHQTDLSSESLVVSDAAQIRLESDQSMKHSADSITDFPSAVSNNINEAWEIPVHGVKTQKKINEILSLGCNGPREPFSLIAPTTDASESHTLSGDLPSYSSSIDNSATVNKTNAAATCLFERKMHESLGSQSSYQNSNLPVISDNIKEIAPVRQPQVIMQASSISDQAVPHSTQNIGKEDSCFMLELREEEPCNIYKPLECSDHESLYISPSKEAVQNVIQPDGHQKSHQDLFQSSAKYITKAASNNRPTNKDFQDSIKPAEDFARCNDSAHEGPNAASNITDEITASQGNAYDKEMKPKIGCNDSWKQVVISSLDKFDSASKWNENAPRIPALLAGKHCSTLEKESRCHNNLLSAFNVAASATSGPQANESKDKSSCSPEVKSSAFGSVCTHSKAGILFGANSETSLGHEEREPVDGRNHTTPQNHSCLQNTNSKLKKLEDEDLNSPQVKRLKRRHSFDERQPCHLKTKYSRLSQFNSISEQDSVQNSGRRKRGCDREESVVKDEEGRIAVPKSKRCRF